ncbi:putative solute carrier organic anion transporter family member 1B7 isoform X2 [Branchiostoma floridae]|uniref:Solute carrier organic anion transporter family member n=1 Tax=Branchiostoma floridae TaxID=7739 RepID=A0A9J7HQT0_BRAFL|nr:putative solute carrier organic anion transporter family member 1B7 isoform X2 [Branchiostoma floridae]
MTSFMERNSSLYRGELDSEDDFGIPPSPDGRRLTLDYAEDPEEEFKLHENRCGCCQCTPDCCQCFANPALFSVVWTFAITLCNLWLGYTQGILTTVEKVFDLESKLSGFIYGSNDLGFVSMILLVSYFGGKPNAHRPKMIAIGIIIMALSCFFFALPHFGTGGERYWYKIQLKERTSGISSLLCRAAKQSNETVEMECDARQRLKSGGWVITMVIAQFISGMGEAPLLPLGTTYLDDHVSKLNSVLYIGLSLILPNTGQPLGLLLSSYTLRYHVNWPFADSTRVGIDYEDPRWIGAWWLGFVPIGLAFLLTAVPMMCFPRKMRHTHTEEVVFKEPDEDDPLEDIENVEGQLIKFDDIPGLKRLMRNLMTNMVYITLVLAAACVLSIGNGFVTFLPKYISVQFGLSTSAAARLLGFTVLPAAMLGTVASTVVMRVWHISDRGMVLLCAAISFVLCLLTIPAMGLFCDQQPFAGLTTSYHGKWHRPRFNFLNFHTYAPLIEDECNQACHCLDEEFAPVCGANDVTYFSPCYAGCKDRTKVSNTSELEIFVYSHCACVHHGVIPLEGRRYSGSYAESNQCPDEDCTSDVFLVFLLFITAFIMTFFVTPFMIAILRSVGTNEGPMAFGAAGFFGRILGGLLAPVIFGAVIDVSCIIFAKRCGRTEGECLLYDVDANRYLTIGLTGIYFWISFMLLSAGWVVFERGRGNSSKYK